MGHASDAPTYVYFIRPIGMEGPVKIGCSVDPAQRRRSLMVSSPFRLEIAAQMLGDEELERRFHALFADDHTHSEWFAPSEALSAMVQQVATGDFDVETLPDPRRVTGRWIPKKYAA